MDHFDYEQKNLQRISLVEQNLIYSISEVNRSAWICSQDIQVYPIELSCNTGLLQFARLYDHHSTNSTATKSSRKSSFEHHII
jgi:hypothetical protein